MPYIPHTDDDIKTMLETIGVDSIDALFDEIPDDIRAGKLEKVQDGISEMAAHRLMSDRARADGGYLSFIGAGAYDHHVPAAVWDVAARGEFYTAYTPYQAEASQGTLQVIYEYQTMMAELTAMDVSNASLYDGASALAEAVLMAVRAKRGAHARKVLMPGTVNPFYRSVSEAIVVNQGIACELVDYCPEQGALTVDQLKPFEGQDFVALVLPMPNFFGVIEDVHALTNWAHQQGMLVIAVVNPTALAVLSPPGHWGEQGADIVVGEGQPLGIPLASGGPYLGFMCCKQKYVRQMPGRIIGRTEDLEGKPGFTLTLQAREQHIRRSKATSNICTNQGLTMTAATIYMALLGFEGLEQVATSCHAQTGQLLEKLTSIKGVKRKFTGPLFHEAVIELPVPVETVCRSLESQGIQGGFALGTVYEGMENCLLVCATETKTDADIEGYRAALESVVSTQMRGQGQ